MDYKTKHDEILSRYEEMKSEYVALTETPEYQKIISVMPFSLLSAKHTYETLELFNNLTVKPKIRFKSVEEAEVLYRNLSYYAKNIQELLDCSAYIVNIDELAKKINDFVDESPYLPSNLKIEEKGYLSDIAKDCLTNLPEYRKLVTFEFRYNFIESCLYSLSSNDLALLVKEKMINTKDIDNISLTGNEKYEENLRHLCLLTNHKKIVERKEDVRLKGVTYNNEDGKSRQAILAKIRADKESGKEIKLVPVKHIYTPPLGNPEPAVSIYYENELIGTLPLATAQEIEESYINSQISVELKEIKGSDLLGCEVTVSIIAPKLNREFLETTIADLEKQYEEVSKDPNKKKDIEEIGALLKLKKDEYEKLVACEKDITLPEK